MCGLSGVRDRSTVLVRFRFVCDQSVDVCRIVRQRKPTRRHSEKLSFLRRRHAGPFGLTHTVSRPIAKFLSGVHRDYSHATPATWKNSRASRQFLRVGTKWIYLRSLVRDGAAFPAPQPLAATSPWSAGTPSRIGVFAARFSIWLMLR
jgi:hypothetical protein